MFRPLIFLVCQVTALFDLWGVDDHYHLFQANGNLYNMQDIYGIDPWSNGAIAGRIDQIDVDGKDVFAIGGADQLWYLDTRTDWRNRLNAWVNVPGNFKYVDVSDGGNRLWALDPMGIAYYCEGKEQCLEGTTGNGWRRMTKGPLLQISASNEHIFAINPNNDVLYRHRIATRNKWKVVGRAMKHVSVSDSGAHVFAVGLDNCTYYKNGASAKNWVKFTDPTTVEGVLTKLVQVTSCGGGLVFGAGVKGGIYYKIGVDEWRSYPTIHGGLNFVTCSSLFVFSNTFIDD